MGLCLTWLGLTPGVAAQEHVDGFAARTYLSGRGPAMPYRLFIPPSYDGLRAYPLIVYLHGSGGLGSDNLLQISGGNTNGTHVWAKSEVQAAHPAFVLAPQAPEGASWGGPELKELSPAAQTMLEIVAGLEKEFHIDRTRIYLTGQSLGGFGTWDILVRHPGIFAAAVPLCGSGKIAEAPFRKVYSPAEFATIKDVPIWVFQGAADSTAPVQGVRETIATLRSAGSKVKYTEYAGVEHQVWERAYLDRALIEWMFAQHLAE
jgi:predicted peptidase